MRGFLSFLILCFSLPAMAIDYPYYMRSAKGLLMGDAFTAVNDDEMTLFYNPASLGRHKRDFTLYPFPGQLGGTNVLNDLDKFKDFPSEPGPAGDLLMDYPVHASGGVAPGFKLFNVGVSFIANESYDLLLRNRAYPMLDVDLRSDRGVMMGFAIPIGHGRLNRKTGRGQQTSLGVSAKYIERTGIRDTLALTGPVVLGSLNEDEIDQIVKSLGRVKGIGWGFDAGIEHVIRDGATQFVFGLAALDITGTEFKVDKNADKLKVADTPNQINLGMAFGQDYKLFHYILSADVRALNEEMDFGKRLRLGAEVGVPGLKLLGGVNSGYYSYGAALEMGFMELTAGFYDIEIGRSYKQTKSRRFVVYLSLFDFSFDA